MSTTSASTSRGRRKKRKPRDLNPLRQIRITDNITGTLLFERIYEWPDQTNTSNLGSLIQSFFQFAREVDGGDVESVYFEEGTAAFLPSATPRSIGSGDHRMSSYPTDSMKLIKSRSEEVTVFLFHECLGPEQAHQEVFNQLVNAASSEFSSEFGTVIANMRSSFSELNDDLPVSRRLCYIDCYHMPMIILPLCSLRITIASWTRSSQFSTGSLKL